MKPSTQTWIDADKAHCWHPFTRQLEWCSPNHKPVVITQGKGVWLWDSEGNRYLDANSSIWTNIHGHSHPHLVQAIQKQAAHLAHSSFLGFTNPKAIELAEKLCAFFPAHTLERVFFSDNGSTAVECALKMALQFHQQQHSPQRQHFIAFQHAYHGDTLGAASLGGVSRFFERFQHMGFPTTHVEHLSALKQLPHEVLKTIAAVVIEPLIQGVHEMRPWEKGMLQELRHWCNQHDILLILDEVMTGFGRTGSMFACMQENVIPDFLCLAKGITGGTMPLAATLTSARIYDAFLGNSEHAFYYGHSYTGNPLGCAAALASLEVFEQEQVLSRLPEKVQLIRDHLHTLQQHPHVFETRQCGMIAGIELRQANGDRFPTHQRLGELFCTELRQHHILTRPILDTIVIMPPLSITASEIDFLFEGINQTLSKLF